ncbi:MAG: exodeoxyribonuclease III [Sphingomonadaceae bacterium]
MKLATFNVNGIAARLPRVMEWLAHARPDVVGLQEIKCEDARFPRAAFEAEGWHVETHGQKSFNGVAILSRAPIENVTRGLPGDAADDQARYIEARIAGIRFANIYLPNGNPQPGPKFLYKLAWMERLAARARELLATEAPVVMAGDFNVCPTAEDVARPDLMADDALCQPESRAAWRALVAQGWTEATRARFPGETIYTFWDYQAGAWAKNWGLRIDHILLSPAAADRMLDTGVDRDARAADKASDHVPVWVELA